jgi:hypothetical protein
MNILKRISVWLSKSQNRKAFAALTFIFIGLAAMVFGAWLFGKQSVEQKELMEQMQQEAVRRPVETERLHQEAVRKTAEILVGQMQQQEYQRRHMEAQRQQQKQMMEAQRQHQEYQRRQRQLRRRPQLGLPKQLGLPNQQQQYQRWYMEAQRQHQEYQKRIEEAKVEFSPVDLILHTMQWGNIAFNAPTSMNLDETARIQLLLGIKQTIEELKQDIKVEIEKKHLSGDIEEARIKVAPLIMQAHLEGNSFEIKSITPDEQPISSEVTTEWLWEIIPKRAGRNILNLTLNAKLPIEGNSTYRTIRTFKKEIGVDVTSLQQTENFIKDNWQWLWTAFFVPVGAWLWSKRGSSSAMKAT